MLNRNEYDRVKQLINRAGLPTEIPEVVTTRQLIEKMYTDKKVRREQLHFVFMDGIGRMKRFGDSYSMPVEERVISEVIDSSRI